MEAGAALTWDWDLAVLLLYMQTWTPSGYGLGELRAVMAKGDADKVLAAHAGPMQSVLRGNLKAARASAAVLAKAGSFMAKAHHYPIPTGLSSTQAFLKQPFNKAVERLALSRIIIVAGGPHHP